MLKHQRSQLSRLQTNVSRRSLAQHSSSPRTRLLRPIAERLGDARVTVAHLSWDTPDHGVRAARFPCSCQPKAEPWQRTRDLASSSICVRA